MFGISQVGNGLEIRSDGTVPVLIKMDYLGFDKLIVVTTIKELTDSRAYAKKENRNDLYRSLLSVKSALTTAYLNIDEIHQEQGERWDNMMADCLLLAVYTETLFRKPVNIMKIDDMS